MEGAMNVLDAEFAKGFGKLANDGWIHNFHERNGGNLSYRMKAEEVESVKECFIEKEWKSIGIKVPYLKNEFFMMTGSGKFFQNIQDDLEGNACIIEVDDKGENYRQVWGLKNGGKPTSELPAHLMNLEVKKKINDKIRVVYHAHPANIVALTFVLPLTDEAFTRELWEMITECAMVYPSGIGVVEWMVPGSMEVAVATSEKMKLYDAVVWAHHGLFAAGEDFDFTFGLMHTIEKAAEILVKVKSMCPNKPDKNQTITIQNFRDLAKDYNLDLPERFLFEK